MLSVDDEVSMLEIEQVAPTNFEDLVAEEVAEEFEVLFRLSVPPNEVSMMVKATKSVYDMALKALVEMGHASDHDSAIDVCFAGAPVGERTFEELGVDECGVVTIMWLRLTWTKAASIAEAVNGAAAAAAGGKLYCMGGKSGERGRLDTMECFDPTENERGDLPGRWTPCPSMVRQRSGATAVALNDQIYVLGGWDGRTIWSSMERFDPRAQTWTDMPEMLVGRMDCVVVALDGKIVVTGGLGSNGEVLNSTEVFDASSSAWSMGPPMLHARQNAAASVVNGKLIVVGGTNPRSNFSNLAYSVEELDPATQRWAELPAVRAPRIGAVGCALRLVGHSDEEESKEEMFVIGGSGNLAGTDNGHAMVERFDPTTREWAITNSAVPEPRHNAAGAVLDHKLYVIAGYVASLGRLDTVQVLQLE